MPNLETYFLQVSVHVSIKVVTSNSFKDKKKLRILRFLDYLSKSKTEECDQKE